MQEYRLIIQTPAGRVEAACRADMSLLDAINAVGPPAVPAPCGGKGRCGKCRIRILAGQASPPSAEERRRLGAEAAARGVRLACLAFPMSDLSVEIPREEAVVDNKTALFDLSLHRDPYIVRRTVRLAHPRLEDQRADRDRLLAENGLRGLELPARALAGLPGLLRSADFTLTVASDGKSVIGLDPGPAGRDFFGAAVDIGTTTVAAYLIDLADGTNVDVVSALNAQKTFGADVISRINHTIEHPDGLEKLRALIVGQIMELIDSLAARNGLRRSAFRALSLAGNTTMLHLACGLPPAAIAAAPFIPVAVGPLEYAAPDFGLELAEGARVYVLPSISAYVGADIVAAAAASGMPRRDDLSLLLDIGTNGEIVLGGAGGLLCCSTAAGPAFEGAHISRGVGGIAGAINAVSPAGGDLAWTTIASARPVGLCGSGIVDLAALLLGCGLIDETGRMLEPAEAAARPGRPPGLTARVLMAEGEPAFQLAEDILFTQKDVREVQLAKAAIAAGVATLLKLAGKRLEEVDCLYLAGGFGSYIRRESACAIGLLPKTLEPRIKVIGNAAGHGAALYLVSRARRDECLAIPSAARYVELSASAEFQEAYIENMYFGQPG